MVNRSYIPTNDLEVRYLDDDPVLAARYHPDQVLTKALVDSCKLLSSVWISGIDRLALCDWMPHLLHSDVALPDDSLRTLGAFIGDFRIYANIEPVNTKLHPHLCWVHECGGNYNWLRSMAMSLCDEHKKRGKYLSPVLLEMLMTLELTPPSLTGSSDNWTEPPFIGPLELEEDCTVHAYRNLMAAQTDRLTWTPELPYWIGEHYRHIQTGTKFTSDFQYTS